MSAFPELPRSVNLSPGLSVRLEKIWLIISIKLLQRYVLTYPFTYRHRQSQRQQNFDINSNHSGQQVIILPFGLPPLCRGSRCNRVMMQVELSSHTSSRM